MDQVLRAALRRRAGTADADRAGGVCLDAETLAAWSAGALPESDGQAIEQHLATCARCQEMAAIFVQSEPPVSTTTLVAFKPRWSFRWIAPIAAAAAASVTWLAWPVRPQTVPPKEGTTVARAEPDARQADIPREPGSTAPPAAAPSAPAPKLERIAPADEAKRLAQPREAPAGAEKKNQDKDARDRRLEAGRSTLADAQAAGGARPVPPETRADPKLAAAPIQAPIGTAAPPPQPAATPAPPPPPATPPPPAAGTVAGGMGQGQGAGVGAARGAGTAPPPPPGGAVGGVVGGVPSRAEEVRQQPTFRATLDGIAPVVVAEFSSGAGFAESLVGVAGGGGGGRAAGRGGAGGRGGGGAAAAPAANAASPATMPRWRIFSSGSVERSADAGASWQPLPIDPPVQVIAGTSPSPAICWLIGRGAVVLLSTDGLRFARVPFQQATELTSIRATSARDATVTTPDGREFVTNDGGTTWRARE